MKYPANEKFKEIAITPLPVKHGSLDILGFKINNTAYLTDVSDIPESTKALIKGCNTIILSALRWEPEHPTHLTIPQVVRLINEFDVKQGYLSHMNSYVDHEKTKSAITRTYQISV